MEFKENYTLQEKKISELEDKAMDTIQNGNIKRKKIELKQKNISK